MAFSGSRFTRVALLASVSSIAGANAAFAQSNCGSVQSGPINPIINAGSVSGSLGQGSAAIAGAISAVETAFLSQQGSAFVSAPSDPAPNQPGGGIWVRGVGGENNVQSVSNTTLTSRLAPGTPIVLNTTNTTCSNAMRLSFEGVQLGADIARLNWNGWNVHFGSTAGYVGAKTNDTNQLFPFNNTFQVPFLGTYVVATRGRFFADLMVREEVFNMNLSNASYGFSNQPLSAHGYSISTSAGYNYDAGNNWFIEPSAGFTYSRTTVDNFTLPGNPLSAGITGTASFNDIVSELGRVSLRFGRTIETPNIVWQPFATVSVFHEFAGNTSAQAVAPGFIGNAFFAVPTEFSAANNTSRLGTYEQYSLGISGQLVHTGWLGYVRADYKDGSQINGWGASGGLRYQFTPDMIASVMPSKVKAPARPYVAATNWTGFYVGAIAGADYGRTDVTVFTSPSQRERPWVAGGLGGFEAGYNVQFANNWVLGAAGDIVATNTHGARFLPPYASLVQSSPSADSLQVGDNTTWQATATAKLGYAWDRTLYYVKAGGAFENARPAVTCYDPFAANACTSLLAPSLPRGIVVSGNSINTSYTRTGYTAGFGTEFDLGKGWSALSELDYLSFGKHTAVASNGVTSIQDYSNVWQGKIGVNYRFSPGPVMAKY